MIDRGTKQALIEAAMKELLTSPTYSALDIALAHTTGDYITELEKFLEQEEVISAITHAIKVWGVDLERIASELSLRL